MIRVEHATGRGTAERWRRQYQRDGKWMRTDSGDSEFAYIKLCDLGPNPCLTAVAEIIGNQTWSYISCDGCSSYVERAVVLGECDPKRYCEECISEAASVLPTKSPTI